jgi:hypothetical protein
MDSIVVHPKFQIHMFFPLLTLLVVVELQNSSINRGNY